MDREIILALAILVFFACGLLLGGWTQAAQWRRKGDHEYMNRMSSGGKLYQVKRER